MTFKSLGSNLVILIFEKKCELFFDGITVALPQSGARGGARYQKTGFFLFTSFPKSHFTTQSQPAYTARQPRPAPRSWGGTISRKVGSFREITTHPQRPPWPLFRIFAFFSKKMSNE
jgi:hypothetical protein